MSAEPQSGLRPLTAKRYPFTISYLVIGILIILYEWFNIVLVNVLTPFIIGPIMLLLYPFLVLLVIIAIIRLIRHFRHNWLEAIMPVVFGISIIIVEWFVPFHSMWVNNEFKTKFTGMQQVANLVEQGKIKKGTYWAVALPKGYRYLSRGGGDILIDKSDGVTRIFFFTYRGILDNMAGFMYRSDGSLPQDDDFGETWVQIIEYAPHWFYCSGT